MSYLSENDDYPSDRAERPSKSSRSAHHNGGGGGRYGNQPQQPIRNGRRSRDPATMPFLPHKETQPVLIDGPNELQQHHMRHPATVPLQQAEDNQEEDEQWGDNTTCVTGATSEPSYSCEDLRNIKHLKYTGKGALSAKALEDATGFLSSAPMRCVRYLWIVLMCTVCFVAYLTPLAMVLLPKSLGTLVKHTTAHINFTRPWHTSQCLADCQGMLISFAFRMFALLVAVYLLFMRRNVADMPRLYVGRACLLGLVFLLTFAYWLFYGVRIVAPRVYDYSQIVVFALSMVDAMLVIHYLAVILLEVRALRPEYRIRVVRSPDGESRCYNVGAFSIQRAAISILHNYYRDFTVYNPYLERLPGGAVSRMRMKSRGGGGDGGSTTGSSASGFKMYNIDALGGAEGLADVNTQAALMIAAARKRDSSHNERFYEEQDWERRVRKRRARLLTATEEAFAHIKRVHSQEKAPCVPMNSQEAAQAVFPALARSLQKYLRVTRQQPRHTAEQVVRHLSDCLTYDISPRAFLNRFFNTIENTDGMPRDSKWSIVCDHLVSRSLDHGQTFVLRCHSTGADAAVQLLCHVSRLPFLNLTEAVNHDADNRFMLRLNSETSV